MKVMNLPGNVPAVSIPENILSLRQSSIDFKDTACQMTDTIIFDNEGVIVDTEHIWDREQEEFLGRRGIMYERKRTKHLLTGLSLVEGVKILKREYNIKGDDELLAEERLAIIKGLLAADVGFVNGFNVFFNTVRNSYKTCVATSMRRELIEIIDKKLSLNELFEGRIYSIEEVGYKSKPFPDIFLYASLKLKSKPENCLVIEDSPNGIEAALRAGMKCIGLATTYPLEKLGNATLTAKSFDDISIDLIRGI
jgi:beta-phosphoglucomutase